MVTYPDAVVKSPHSDVAVGFCCWTAGAEPKLSILGKAACGFAWTVLLADAGDAPDPGGGANLGAKPPGGGGMTPRPPPAGGKRAILVSKDHSQLTHSGQPFYLSQTLFQKLSRKRPQIKFLERARPLLTVSDHPA